ncbi:MAG: glycosyltransferase family 4 protein [Anaerolineae bacterium]|nr:glycosyltransferase family 4 protein [Anaerolineae bacterium]
MKVLQIGGYPPPIGGTSVHIQRFHLYLLDHGVESRVIDYLGYGKPNRDRAVVHLPRGLAQKLITLIRVSRQTTADTIVHFQVSGMGRFKWAAPLLLALFRRQPKVISIRSGLFIGDMDSRLGRAYLRWLLHHIRKVISVNVEIADYLAGIGIAADKLAVIPGFIPQQPDPALVPKTLAQLDHDKTRVLTSGYLEAYYNFDVLIDCIPHLDSTRYHVVFAFYGDIDPDYERHILARLAAFENVTILRDQPPDVFVSVLAASDIYVRTTRADGDSNAVREALGLGTTVFATDCVQRPDGCALFSHKDAKTLLALFSEGVTPANQHTGTAQVSNADRVFDLYKMLVS